MRKRILNRLIQFSRLDMIRYLSCSWIFLFILFNSGSAQTKFIPFNHPSLYYEGRISHKNDAAELTWSGSSVTIFFKGTNLSAILEDADTANYYNVIIDDKDIFKIHTDTIKKIYVLASGLANKKHKIQLFKRTDWAIGKPGYMDLKLQKPLKYFRPLSLLKEKLNFTATKEGSPWPGYIHQAVEQLHDSKI